MCSVLYKVTIKRDEKVLAVRRVSPGMAGPSQEAQRRR